MWQVYLLMTVSPVLQTMVQIGQTQQMKRCTEFSVGVETGPQPLHWPLQRETSGTLIYIIPADPPYRGNIEKEMFLRDIICSQYILLSPFVFVSPCDLDFYGYLSPE